jgi:hypothetical protein
VNDSGPRSPRPSKVSAHCPSPRHRSDKLFGVLPLVEGLMRMKYRPVLPW